ncbi:hypothetical protein CYMTET_57099 [Cymbomonas tetramitiformis]|uniref:Uncharacterized protein n=1 Tax=Cymbomonas tetramitiformis TaxID=36881 RepID=A0AAE0BA11_9CHLO|nr:hypothetical protein CYMTET_57099 [Cymbomonas tetramitiformis]
MSAQVYSVIIPQGVVPGQRFTVIVNGAPKECICPPNMRSGQELSVPVTEWSAVSNSHSEECHSLRTGERAEWPFPILGCFNYRTPEGKCIWCPGFFPQAVNGPFCLLSTIHTLEVNEEPLYPNNPCFMHVLGTGPKGCLLCMALCVCTEASPLPVHPIIMCFSVVQRRHIMRKYGIGEYPLCHKETLNGLCVPCSAVQVWQCPACSTPNTSHAIQGEGTSQAEHQDIQCCPPVSPCV